MQWHGVLFVAAGFLMGAGDNQADSGQGELKMLQGTWTAVSFEANSDKAATVNVLVPVGALGGPTAGWLERQLLP
jgi:hypothetical protein